MGLCCSTHRYKPGMKGRGFRKIPDHYESIEEVSAALKQSGLESCNIIAGVDFTKSNLYAGEKSFEGRSLHDVTSSPNPYLISLSLISRTLFDFDDDNLIPCYGFGDTIARDRALFSFYPNDQPAKGTEDLIQRYRQIVPHVDLSGPTTFGPLIRQAMRYVYQNNMSFHLLIILSDGEVTPAHVKDTQRAIAEAANFPLGIIMIGVGDGPWDKMKYFDDGLPSRGWDNFQFVEFNKVMRGAVNKSPEKAEADFAIRTLMEVPEQYKIAQHLIGYKREKKLQSLLNAYPKTVVMDPNIPEQGYENAAPSAPPF